MKAIITGTAPQPARLAAARGLLPLPQNDLLEILVALTTDPTLIDMMRKAGAIITDLGGMLSHAAITARELNIPCIVGTEIGTKVLKDGDEVEIDLEKGTVRKI